MEETTLEQLMERVEKYANLYPDEERVKNARVDYLNGAMEQDVFNDKNPSDYMFLKMFDMADAYLCESTGEGWTWKGALEYFKKHWSDEEFNSDYMEVLKNEEEEE